MRNKLQAILTAFLALGCIRAAAAESLVIDAFDYASAEAARQAWRAADGSPPVDLIRRDGGHAAAMVCDWSKVEKRVCYDRQVQLNLAGHGRIAMWLYVDRPSAVAGGTIYFGSGAGWYIGSFPTAKAGWRRVTLERNDFGTEGKVAGWHKIKSVRLSFWKPGGQRAENATVAVDQIEAVSTDVVVVRGKATMLRGSSEAKLAERCAANMAELLRKAGVDCTIIDDADAAGGALAGARLAIFAYNPDISPAEIQAVERFVSAGGRIMLFYCLPKELAKLLGIADGGWMRQQYAGQFATVRFDGRVLDGAPESMQQNSWNARKPRPLGASARAAGEWVDARGRATGITAVTISPAGLYMGHILMGGDEAAKQRFLLSAIAALLPQWKARLIVSAVRQAGRTDGFADVAEIRRFIESRRGRLPADRTEKALELLGRAERIIRDAQRAQGEAPFGSTLASLDEARNMINESLCSSFPSWRPAFRAVWCHDATGIPGWSWDRTIGHLKANGFNAIIVNMLSGGLAHYPSDLLPRSKAFESGGDQIAQCLAACRKHGVELHVWKVCFNLYNAPKEFVDRMRAEGRLQAGRDGREVLWLSPSHPANYQLERDSMLEVVRRYAVDGIHFDYIRYPDSRADYSAGARQRFEQAAAVKVSRWPDDVISGPHAAAFADWRREQITRLVRDVSGEARKIRPGVKVSAAVFSSYPSCRDSIGQDWVAWARSGYLDFLCPMNYTASDEKFTADVQAQLREVGAAAAVYPGIGVTLEAVLSPFQTGRQMMIARQLGAKGFVLFNYSAVLADQHLPALHKGVLAP